MKTAGLLFFCTIAATTAPVSGQTDWGDATDNRFSPRYPTLLSNNGARHTATGPRLGALRDAEADGQPNSSAGGDDATPAGSDDEDGVTIGDLVHGDTPRIRLDVQGGPGFVNAWIDWNRDNDWNDSGERVLTNLPVSAGISTPPVPVPLTASAGTTAARFRITQTSVTAPVPTGLLPSGEVEDYAVVLKAGTDLRLAMSATLTAVPLNQTTTFTLTITNSGPVQATGVSVAFALPAGLTAQGAATASIGSYSGSVWNLGTLSAVSGSNTATLTVTARATASGTPLAYAQITAGTPADTDAVPGNNSGRGQTGDPAHEDDDASLNISLGTAAPPQDVSGRVWFDFDGDTIIDPVETGIPAANVRLRFAGPNGTLGDADDVLSTMSTDAAGDFRFSGRTPGLYSVTLSNPVPGLNTVTFDPPSFTVNNAPVTGRNIGRRGSLLITGFVIDRGLLRARFDEIPIPGIPLSLTWGGPDGDLGTAADNRAFPGVVTNPEGIYSFPLLPPGAFRLQLQAASLPPGFRPESDPDGVETPNTAELLLASSHTRANFVYASQTSVEGAVWFDLDGDGLRDFDEAEGLSPGFLENLQASLVRVSDGAVVVTQPVEEGQLLLEGVPAGDYKVRITGMTAGVFFSPVTADSGEVIGNDILASGESAPFTLDVAGSRRIDAGVSTTGLAGTVRHDSNGDNLISDNDPSPGEVRGGSIQLFRADGTAVGPAQLMRDGFLFGGLSPGSYFVRFTVPAGLGFAAADQGPDESMDSDVLAGGNTALITLAHGQVVSGLSDALLRGTGLSGIVWHDRNGDGQADDTTSGGRTLADLLRLAGVTVDVINAATLLEAAPSQVTGADGLFGFFGLAPGTYMLRVTGLPPGFIFGEGPSQFVNENGVSEPVSLSEGAFQPFLFAGAHDPATIKLSIDAVELLPDGALRMALSFTPRLHFELSQSSDLSSWDKVRDLSVESGSHDSGVMSFLVPAPEVLAERRFIRAVRNSELAEP